jgi:capsular exopolysaccharide synthesis family protein
LEIRDYLRLLRRNWITIVALALAGLLAGGAASLLAKPTYSSVTQLFVAIQSSGSVSELQQGNTFSQARVQSYVKTVSTPAVLDPVIRELGLDVTPTELAQQVKATTDLDTVLISISVTDSSPVQSAAIAEGVAKSLIRAVDNLEAPRNGGESPVRLSIVTPATSPSSPTSPNTQLNLVLGGIIGLLAGVGISALRSLLDNRIRGEHDVRKVTDAPILGAISFDSEAAKNPLISVSDVLGPRSEAFRQLRTNLQFAHISNDSKTVLVTSSIPGEGKSTTATNLAISLSEAGQSVALIDADLRRPMVGEYLGMDRTVGLTTVLIGNAELGDVLQSWGEDDLWVLPSGQIPPNPSELLGSQQMRSVLVRLEEMFDAVIIDAPPLLPVTDSAVLSQMVGGVVVVVGMQSVNQPELEKSLGALDMVQSNILGLVMNRVPTKGPDAYSYGGYYTYESLPEKEAPTKRARPRVEPSTSGQYRSTPQFEALLAADDSREPRRFRNS